MATTIAILGTGAMGFRMAQRLMNASHTVRVWNRTPERTLQLQHQGATAFDTPREAAAGADVVIAMVRDDAASREVWLSGQGAVHALRQGMFAVESSTLSPEFVRKLAPSLEETGAHFVDAPVSGSLPQVEQGQLVYVAGGEAADIDALRPILLTMGRTVQHAGPHGAGATLKLAINALLGIQLAGLSEFFGLLQKNGIAPTRAMEMLSETAALSAAAKTQGELVAKGSDKVLFSLDLMKKDFGYAVEAGEQVGARMPMTEAARSVVTDASARGLGQKNLTALAELYLGDYEREAKMIRH